MHQAIGELGASVGRSVEDRRFRQPDQRRKPGAELLGGRPCEALGLPENLGGVSFLFGGGGGFSMVFIVAGLRGATRNEPAEATPHHAAPPASSPTPNEARELVGKPGGKGLERRRRQGRAELEERDGTAANGIRPADAARNAELWKTLHSTTPHPLGARRGAGIRRMCAVVLQARQRSEPRCPRPRASPKLKAASFSAGVLYGERRRSSSP